MQKKLFILFWLLCCVVCYSAETTYYVDVDVIGGTGDGSSLANAYSSLNVAETARDANITAGNAVRFLCHNTLGNADTTAVNFIGWTTDADSYIKVEAEASYRHAGVYDTSKYHLTSADTTILTISEDYVRFVGLQFGLTVTSGNGGSCITASGINATNDVRVSNCIFNSVSCTGTVGAQGLKIVDSDLLGSIWNCIFYNFLSISNPTDNSFIGIRIQLGSTINIWNCTINDCFLGMWRQAGTVNVVNCLVFENANDFNGTISMTYCASDDDHTGDSGTNFVITQTGDDYAALVVDADGGDYNVTDGSSELVGTGTDDPGGAIQDDTDIAGNARSSTWDIGAFELSAAPSVVPTLYYYSSIPFVIIGYCFILGRKNE